MEKALSQVNFRTARLTMGMIKYLLTYVKARHARMRPSVTLHVWGGTAVSERHEKVGGI